jgi:hypothetical protein
MSSAASLSPRVTVIIPCYGQAHFLPQAIESVLGQSRKAHDIIVVDDGSPDDSAKVAASYGSMVRVVRKPNGGLASARNAGLVHATGDFVQFLDADDYLMPDMHEHILAAALHSPAATVYYGGHIKVDVEGHFLSADPLPFLLPDPFHHLLRGNPFPCHSLVIRRQAFPEPRKAFDVTLGACEDWEAWLRLASRGAVFAPVRKAMVAYRRYPDSMSWNPSLMWLSGRTVLDRYELLHGSCGQCRRSMAAGIRTCDGFFFPHLMEMARQLMTGEIRRPCRTSLMHLATRPSRSLVFLYDQMRLLGAELVSHLRDSRTCTRRPGPDFHGMEENRRSAGLPFEPPEVLAQRPSVWGETR